MSEQENAETPVASTPQVKPPARRGRRRGGRGRSRPKTPEPQEAATPPSAAEGDSQELAMQSPESTSQETLTSAPSGEKAPRNIGRNPKRAPNRPMASTQGLKEAKQQAEQIIETLQHALEDMENLCRLLDQIDQERTQDLKDLESLRRTLNQMQRFRSDMQARQSRTQTH